MAIMGMCFAGSADRLLKLGPMSFMAGDIQLTQELKKVSTSTIAKGLAMGLSCLPMVFCVSSQGRLKMIFLGRNILWRHL